MMACCYVLPQPSLNGRTDNCASQGLGVGVDYSLFIVTRYRRALQSGLDPQRSAMQALNTSGRAVLLAGGTVCIALLGLLTLGLGPSTGWLFQRRSPWCARWPPP